MFRTGSPRLIETVSNEFMTRVARDAEELRLFQALAPTSAMLAPLRARGQSLGVVTFARLDGKAPYTTNDLAVAQEMVRRAALALDNVRLYRAEKQAREEAERTTERISRLQAITAALVEKRPLYDMAAFVLEEAQLAVGARFGAVARLVDAASDMEVLRVGGYAATTEVTTELRRWERVPLVGSGTWEDAVRSKEAIFFTSGAERAARYPRLGGTQRTLGFDGSATLPLLVDERVVGVLWLGFAQPHDFSHAERDFLRALARQCAQAIDRARLDEAERNARAAAEAAVRARDEFLSVAAHELKTPVTSLQGFAQLELRHLTFVGRADPARIERALQIINHQSHKLNQLIQQLLDLSRIEEGKLELTRGETELRGLVEGIVTSIPGSTAKPR